MVQAHYSGRLRPDIEQMGTVMSTLRFVPPSARHVPLIRGYWCVEDWMGVHVGKPITTGPSAGSLVTVNFGRPNSDSNGVPGPRVALSGLYTRLHQWQSCAETCFIMVLLSPQGLARLFPGLGSASVDRVLDVGAFVGDSVARQLEQSVTFEQVINGQVGALERWFDERLASLQNSTGVERIQQAIQRIARREPIELVSESMQVSRRSLYTWSIEHLGVGPKALSTLARLERSISSIQRGIGDPIDGYSDQAHQIRDWKKTLGQTPLRYQTQHRSELAMKFGRATADAAHAGTLYV